MSASEDLIIAGEVASGLGKGGYFISLGWVQAQLTALMGASPFLGTLNLRVAAEQREALIAHRRQFVVVKQPNSTACAGYLANVKLTTSRGRTIEAWIILPELTAHADILEVVSPYNLRGHLALNDGDKVTVQVRSS